LARAKAVQEQVEKIITLAKRGDLHAIRQINRLIYNQKIGTSFVPDKQEPEKLKPIALTTLRRIVQDVAPRFTERAGGYTRIVHAPPRRGDAAPMAVLELVS
jgi:large subunit ribosomal protein L17